MGTSLPGSTRSRVWRVGSCVCSVVLSFVVVAAAPADQGGQASARRNGASPPSPQGPAKREPNLGGEIDLSSQDPDVALSRLKVADGYEVNLFASEREFRELAKPVAMTFDTRGRLWVLTAPTYPHYLPGRPPKDKLIILEDTDRDGRADTSTVFADGLYIPTGFELGDGGAYVSQQPNLVFLRDTNGDDRADERRIVLHGFGTEDSHHAIHTFTWGPGGGLYFQEGTFLHSQVETPYGPVRLRDAGVFRYEPRTEQLSVFVSYPFANPWGHVIDRWGQNFISDASNGYHYYGTAFSGHMHYPDKHRPMKEWTLTRVRPICGTEFVRSRHFPEAAQGNFLFNNVIGFHGIKQYRVSEEGSGFVAVEIEPLLQSSDLNFRPIALQFGPDGALYVGDWFNPLVGHMQYSLRDPRRDSTHGRVWRITAKGRPLLDPPRAEGASIEAQLDLLKAYEDRTRYRARLALRSQPTEAVVKAVRTWVAGLDASDSDYEHHLLEALWVLQHHDSVEPDLLARVLAAREFRARAAGVRVLHHWLDRVDRGFETLVKMVQDPASRVRLEAVRALSFVPTPEAAEAALESLRHPTDYYLDYVLDATLRTLENVWKPVLTAGRPFAADNPMGLSYVLARLTPAELVALPGSVPVYQALLATPGVELGHRRQALEGLARANGTSPLGELLAAIERVDGRPGSSQATKDLADVLVATDRAALQSVRGELERLAVHGTNEQVRTGAFAAMVQADGRPDAAWQLASRSPASRIDLLSGVPLIPDAAARNAMYPHVAGLLATDMAASTHVVPPLAGRYVRIVMPGRRVLSLSEVQVWSGGQNIAPSGTATQSSTVAGGAIGGHAPNAIDDHTTSRPDGSSSAFTSVEQDPWWEVDLGAVRPIDSITLWPRGADGTADTLHLRVLDQARQPVFVRDGLPAEPGSYAVPVGGDFTGPLLNAAIFALPAMTGHEAEQVRLLTPLVSRPPTGAAAVGALRRIAPPSWPADQAPALAASALEHVRSFAPEERTGPAFAQAVALGRELAAQLPDSEASRINATLDQLMVRTIRITAVLDQLRFDTTEFTVHTGEAIEIVLVNPDLMPHNLLITAPGALERVALKAEAMAATADGFAKGFVPDTPDVLQATPLVNQSETARLRLSAPSNPGDYPFVCTFPGHWRTMNGVMHVAKGPEPTAARPKETLGR
jgi:azurin